MPPSLLESQLATLEEPSADEDAIPVDVELRPDEIVELVADRLGPRG
jgi:gluconokinase